VSPRPYSLVAELSYRCPLACAYCSNPIDFHAYDAELDAATWARVFRQAAALGVVQAHLSGGEPLVRRDLEDIARSARDAGLYVHLVTSGIPLTEERAHALVASGVEAAQVSLQGTDDEVTERVAGLRCHARKLDATRWLREAGLPVTINVVIHRDNIDRVAAIIDLAEQLGARRLELANVQLLAWALRNQAALLPDDEAIQRAREIAVRAQDRLVGKMEIVFVLPDYFRGRPRACMGGWGASTIVVAPDGTALPCHAARSIEGMTFPRVTNEPLAQIWNDSPAFVRFRGDAWMPEPCRSCPERARDHGGCRCQAFALTGDAARTDPACDKSTDHAIVLAVRRGPRRPLLELRRRAESPA
jgi:pyrroloquinoline quinone biosynthesis protein E